MQIRPDYLSVAKANETMFRNILRDLKANRRNRPGGRYVPQDLETEAPLDEIFAKYSLGKRYGIFTICDFEVSDEIAVIHFQDIAILSGGGASLVYSISGDEAQYLRPELVMMS